jgi:hypothetical protein
VEDVKETKILVGKPETKELLEVEMSRYEDNIKMNFKQFGS